MKYGKKTILFFFVNLLFCNNVSSCNLDVYLNKSKTYKSYRLEQEEGLLNNNSIISSFLPEISIGMGQYINNDRGFVPLGKSSFYISASQLIFSGNSFINDEEKIEIESKWRELSFIKDKYDMLLKLYADIIQYEYINENILLTNNRLKKNKEDYDKSQLDLKIGNLAKIDLDVKLLNLLKLENTLKGLKDDLELLGYKITENYSIPPEDISKIKSEDILSCKVMGYSKLLERMQNNKLQKADIDFDINNAALFPSVYVSLGLTPKNEGTLRDLDLNKINYSGGISVSIPLSNMLKAIDNQKQFAINVSKARIEAEKDQKELIMTKKDLLNKYEMLKRSIPVLKKEVDLKNKKMNYKFWLVKEKRESVLSYLDSQDELYEAEINLKKDERDLKYYQVYLDFIN